MMASPGTPNVIVLLGESYDVGRELGEGAFGKVYELRRPDGLGRVYAMKEIRVENQEGVDMVRNEFDTLKTCNGHNHIVNIYGAITTQNSSSTFLRIVMEYCDGGNLNSRLERPSDNGTNLRWMKELADAISYLHSRKIAHRDLKPENVLLTANDSIKLGDFGLAREYAVLKQTNAVLSDEVLMSYLNRVYMGTILGTEGWMAPEVFTGHYKESADVFALGAIFYAILTRAHVASGGKKYYGAFVYVNGQTIGLGKAMTQNRNLMVTMEEIPSPTRELIRGMLDYYPENRPTAQNVLENVESVLENVESVLENVESVNAEPVDSGACWLS